MDSKRNNKKEKEGLLVVQNTKIAHAEQESQKT